MIVLGGMGSIPGVVLGAIILVVVPEVLREYATYRLTIFGIGLTLMMLVRPEGLWPVRVRRSVALDVAAPSGGRRCGGGAAVELLPGAVTEVSAAAREGFLAIDGVSKSFGGLRAVNNVSFSVARGQLVAVIGPNGAGQDDAVQPHHGRLPGDGGHHPLRRARSRGFRRHEVTALGVARRIRTSGCSGDVRAGQCPRRRPPPHERQRVRCHAAHPPGQLRGAGERGPAQALPDSSGSGNTRPSSR